MKSVKAKFQNSNELHSEMFEVGRQLGDAERKALYMVLRAVEKIEYAQKLFVRVSENATHVSERPFDWSFNELGELQLAREADQRLCDGRVQFKTAMDVVSIVFDTEEKRQVVENLFTFPE